MKIRAAIIFFIHLTFLIIYQTDFLLSQPNQADFMPLAVGNAWVYEFYSPTPPPNGTSYRFKSSVTKDSLINDHRFYFITNTKYISYFDTLNWFRTDSTNGNFLAYKPELSCRHGNEILIDSLASDPGNTAFVCSFAQSSRMCFQKSLITLFSQQVESKVFNDIPYVATDFKTYAKRFGISRCYTAEMGEYTYTLLGCIINGIKYGDTTLIGLLPISTELPVQYKLYQNYPNPFNPKTMIKFDISPSPFERAGVRLIIYDLLGRVVATLVNDGLKPGRYDVEWDGSSFASGVYLYTLITDNYSETKKLILLK